MGAAAAPVATAQITVIRANSTTVLHLFPHGLPGLTVAAGEARCETAGMAASAEIAAPDAADWAAISMMTEAMANARAAGEAGAANRILLILSIRMVTAVMATMAEAAAEAAFERAHSYLTAPRVVAAASEAAAARALAKIMGRIVSTQRTAAGEVSEQEEVQAAAVVLAGSLACLAVTAAARSEGAALVWAELSLVMEVQ